MLAALLSRNKISFPKNPYSGKSRIGLQKIFAMNRVFSGAALVSNTYVRTVSTTAVQRLKKPDISKLKRKQMHFQVENGVPVFLKGGPTDYVLYYTTWALTIGGVILSGKALYNLAKK